MDRKETFGLVHPKNKQKIKIKLYLMNYLFFVLHVLWLLVQISIFYRLQNLLFISFIWAI